MSIVAVVAAGAMGAAVGRRLALAGCTVLTNLDGRSAATKQRAAEAQMVDKSYADIAKEASFVLSILPPRDAFTFAESFATAAAKRDRSSNPLVFADCNAVNPETVKQISKLFEDRPEHIQFVDAGIIGGPPKDDYNPTFYASANNEQALAAFEKLSNVGLKISLLRGEGAGIGDASALKMSYAGISKGTIALWTTMILAAHSSSPATATALLNELNSSQPTVLARIKGSVPSMLPKAYRWVGEMEEISGFVGENEADIYHGIAKLYKRIEDSLEGDGSDIKALERFVEEAKNL